MESQEFISRIKELNLKIINLNKVLNEKLGLIKANVWSLAAARFDDKLNTVDKKMISAYLSQKISEELLKKLIIRIAQKFKQNLPKRLATNNLQSQKQQFKVQLKKFFRTYNNRIVMKATSTYEKLGNVLNYIGEGVMLYRPMIGAILSLSGAIFKLIGEGEKALDNIMVDFGYFVPKRTSNSAQYLFAARHMGLNKNSTSFIKMLKNGDTIKDQSNWFSRKFSSSDGMKLGLGELMLKSLLSSLDKELKKTFTSKEEIKKQIKKEKTKLSKTKDKTKKNNINKRIEGLKNKLKNYEDPFKSKILKKLKEKFDKAKKDGNNYEMVKAFTAIQVVLKNKNPRILELYKILEENPKNEEANKELSVLLEELSSAEVSGVLAKNFHEVSSYNQELELSHAYAGSYDLSDNQERIIKNTILNLTGDELSKDKRKNWTQGIVAISKVMKLGPSKLMSLIKKEDFQKFKFFNNKGILNPAMLLKFKKELQKRREKQINEQVEKISNTSRTFRDSEVIAKETYRELKHLSKTKKDAVKRKAKIQELKKFNLKLLAMIKSKTVELKKIKETTEYLQNHYEEDMYKQKSVN